MILFILLLKFCGDNVVMIGVVVFIEVEKNYFVLYNLNVEFGVSFMIISEEG